jgi:hypothetical protein
MMVIEMREASREKAFDLIDEIKDLGHRKKLALCELEDTLYECFESEKDDHEEEDTDMNYRRGKSYRYRRSSIRDRHDDEDMYEDRRHEKSYDMRGMRMRKY